MANQVAQKYQCKFHDEWFIAGLFCCFAVMVFQCFVVCGCGMFKCVLVEHFLKRWLICVTAKLVKWWLWTLVCNNIYLHQLFKQNKEYSRQNKIIYALLEDKSLIFYHVTKTLVFVNTLKKIWHLICSSTTHSPNL